MAAYRETFGRDPADYEYWDFSTNAAGPGSGMDGAGQVKSIAVSPDFTSDHTLFAGVQDDQLYKSIDGGALLM